MSTNCRPAKLLSFCEFLSQHFQCNNVELLTRIVSEFQDEPRSFDTVKKLLRFSYPVIAIEPEAITSDAERIRALERATETRYDGHGEDLVELHRSLKPRILMHNWDWLLQIYADFCVGTDRTLMAFVHLRRQAISVLPMVPCDVMPSVSRPHSLACVSTASTPRHVPHRQSGHERASRTLKPSNSAPASPSHHLTTITEEVEDLLAAIHLQCKAIEAQKPWETIFDVATMTFPFDSAKHREIALALRRFWTRHARAVWERNFWHRFPQHQTGDADYVDRKTRQRSAASAFEANIVVPLFNELGAEFFLELDEQSEPHSWWWYRGPLVDLLCVASAHGLDACLHYQKSQALTRFPVAPDDGVFRPYLHPQGQGASMWSTMVSSQHIVVALKNLKQARARTKDAADTTTHTA